MELNIRLVAFAAALLLGAGFALKGRMESAQSKAPLGGMHKCVGDGTTIYTTDDCAPGTKRVEMGGGGTVTTMHTNLDGAASSKKNSIPNARELLNDPAEAAKLQELKDKRMEAIIDGRRP